MPSIPLTPQTQKAVEAFLYALSLPAEQRREIFGHLDKSTIQGAQSVYPSFLTGADYAEASVKQLAALRDIAGPLERNILNDSRLN